MIPVSFCIHSFSGRSAAIRFAAMALLVALLTGLTIKACNYLIVDDSKSYTRLTMHELYETEGAIDTLFLGSSHCFRAYDPNLFTELTGKTAFNLGSSSQNYDTSYYLLREAVRTHEIKTVYLDMHYKFLFVDKTDRDLVQANIISDYMKPSFNKLEFLTQTAELRQLTNRIFPFRRDWKKLGDPSYIKEVLKNKQTRAYRDFEPVVLEQERYAGKGFVYSEEELDAEAITWWENFGKVEEDMNSTVTYTLSYLERIVKLCREENIRLILVTAPSFDEYLEAIGPYDPAHAYIKELAAQYEVPYLDLNLCKEEYLSLAEDSFLDVDHLNGKGAGIVTELLAQMDSRLDSGQLNIDEYFNPWYDER
ncbi:MAG: hypothetical protein HFI29_09785 [Lachnospiraceae bacterium]|jgi:hypothetical protein|nr:hypothetical protein [Lachnospiraceae bacterium]